MFAQSMWSPPKTRFTSLDYTTVPDATARHYRVKHCLQLLWKIQEGQIKHGKKMEHYGQFCLECGGENQPFRLIQYFNYELCKHSDGFCIKNPDKLPKPNERRVNLWQ